MNKKAPLCLVISLAILSLLIIPAARAQSAFSNAVMNLNPVAYWPLQETVQPPAADMEINLGSFGAAGNAVYSSTNVTKGTAPIPGENVDSAVTCGGSNGSFLAVPTTGGAATLPAGPFSVEVWVNPASVSGAQTIISQTGATTSSGGLNNSPNAAGWSLDLGFVPSLSNNIANSVTFHVYNGNGWTGGTEASFAASSVTPGAWYHIVGVFDGTNALLEVNKVLSRSLQPINGTQALDTWDPLTIGCGHGLNKNDFNGSIDEVAIYTYALTTNQINTHDDAGFNGGGSYQATILADHPYMYWRMDAPAHTTPDFSAYPTAFNYGSGANINGLYLAGTTPGAPGPNLPGFASPSLACAMNGIGTDDTNAIPSFTNGVPYAINTAAQTGIIITNLLDSMNLTTNNKTFMCWFKENPSDNHRGVLVGHSDNGWRTSMDPRFVTANTSGKDAPGGDTTSNPLLYNDGNWHFAAIVYTNTGLAKGAGWLATNYMYVDGLQVASLLMTNPAAPGTFTNVTIGAPPDKTAGNGNAYTAQVLAGSIAHVAYFTNALTQDQIINLYTNATGGVSPTQAPVIILQPFSPRINGAGGTNGAGPGSFVFMGVVYNAASTLPSPTLQWYHSSTSNYAGAAALTTDNIKYIATTNLGNIGIGSNVASNQMTISNLVDSDSGYYYVVLGNGYGYTTSILASLTVHTEPFFSSQTPAAGTLQLYQNQNFTLSVTPGGTNFTFQWYSNGVATAVTSTSYPLTGVPTSISGSTYYCVASNASGTATSGTVTLSVLPVPAAITGSAYASGILALNPTAYFPMHETAPAAAADSETNYGTLGSVADGTYADWNVNNGFPDSQVIRHGINGALANDPDPAEQFNFHGQTNSYLFVPRTSPKTTITLPFTIECWVNGANNTFGDIVSEDGTTLNVGNSNNKYGFRLSWGGNIQVLIGSGSSIIPAPSLSFFQWHHVVLTGDTNNNTTNITLYVDGNFSGSATTAVFLPDGWDPLTIGAGLWNNGGVTRIASDLSIDEVAIYNTNLDSGTVSTHYNDGISGAAGQYFTDVSSLHPLMYYRMNRDAYSLPDSSTWPVMNNYGVAGGNGVYTPGLAPGSAAGPNNGSVFAANLSGTNAPAMNGISTFASAFNPTAFNVIGKTNGLSFSLWFRGNPADSRYETLISQGPGWQMAVQQNGTLQFFLGNGFVNSHTVCNDGNWHQVVVTYTNFVGSIYVDGLLDAATNSTSLTNPPAVNNLSMCIGTDPRFTTPNQATGAGRQFAGDICEVAFWNGTVLTANQVQSLYNSAGAAPLISVQPVSASADGNTGFTNSVVAVGSAPLSYQWYKNNLPLPTGGQTNLTIGGTNASLVINPVQSSDASADYYVVVTNNFGAVTSSVVSLTVFTVPVFTNEPILVTLTNNIQLFAGATPTFKVGVEGARPTYLQWFTNGVAATPQATNLTSFTFSAQPGESFYCVASNSFAVVTDNPVSVTIINAPTAPYPAAVLQANPIGYWRLDETTNSSGNSSDVSGVLAEDFWGGNNGIYTNADLDQQGYSASTDPAQTAVQFGIDSLTDGDAFGIGGIDFSSTTNSVTFSVEAWVKGYTQTKDAGIVSKGYGGGGEQFDLDTGSDNVVQNGTTNQHCFRFFVRDASGGTHGASSKILPDGNWHHLVGVCDEVNSNVTLYVDGSVAASTSIAPHSGLLSSSRLMLIGSRPSNSTTTTNDDQFVGTIDDVAVYNYALTANQVGSQYSTAGVAPNLTQAPATNITANGFGTLTLPAAAVGSPTLSYTWYDTQNGTNVTTGSTNQVPLNATLNVASVPAGWNGDTLELTVQNAYGQTNYFVTLTVFTNAPVFTLDLPPQVEVVSGKTYTYSVAAVGAQPFFFQWYHGALPISGATNLSLSVVAGSPGSTTYYIVATNAFGATTSTVSTLTSIAQLNAGYATNILSLNPVGYWPLQETNTPAPATIETNYGLLGKQGNAYYAVTNPNPPAVTFNQSGALTGSGDNDPAVFFSGYSPSGPAGATNQQSYAFVPRATSALTIVPPFSAECWIFANGTGTEFGDMFGEGGGTGLNAPDGGGNWGGFRMSYGGNNSGGPNFQFYVSPGNGTARNSVSTSSNSLPIGQWHHCVATYDGTTTTLYIDGVPQVTNSTALAGANTMAPDTWSPLTIGGAMWHNTGLNRAIYATIDEVAVYTNILSAAQVLNHYQVGTGATAGNYKQTITGDQPLLYYRMDCQAFTNAPEVTCPEAVNYGSAAPNGFYLSGVPPGAVSGPTNSILGSNVVAAPINGIFSCVDAGSDPTFNPTTNQSFTAMTWFRTYPSDSHVETIMSHGETNWAMNIDGTTGHLIWNLFTTGSQVTSANILNDGNWHFVAGVFDGTTSNSYLYVDGQLNASLTLTNGAPSEPNARLYLGGSFDHTQVGNDQRFFGGALAQAAFFTNALNAAQIQSLFVATIAPVNPSTNATITRAVLSGTNLVVMGTNNNVPNTSFHYAVLTATNLNTPLSNWILVLSNGGFNPDGTFDYTNPIVPGTPRQFIDVKAVP